MSLSQKHSGKVLVPWFNISEWKSVYGLIYSEESRNWPKALEIIKIWKLRTPLLSAGVEGTLILLEALLVDTNKLSTYEVTHIFSTSLVRFLNLCAANGDRQGTFYKSAMESGLPKWLISLRHDIAHSHNVPSLSMLEMSLKFCLEWLEEKYWEVQHENMIDLVANELDVSLIEDGVYVNCHLNSLEKGEYNRVLMKKIRRFVTNSEKQLSSKEVLEQVNNTLKELIQTNTQEASDKICTLLIQNNVLLSTELESDESGDKRIGRTSINQWNSLLNIMHETEIMPNLVHKLFLFLCNQDNDVLYKEIASLWIREVFQSLITQESNFMFQNKDLSLRFIHKNNSMKDRTFVNQVLENLTPYTPTFIKEVLEYNEAPPQFIEDALSLISSFHKFRLHGGTHVSTVDDLNLKTDSLVENTKKLKKSHWVLIEDTSPYKKMPLGVLPHQNRNMNPVLEL